jgi:hypothetical protein
MSPLLEESMMTLQKQYIDPGTGTVPTAVFWGAIIEGAGQGVLAAKFYRSNPGIPIDANRVTHLWLGDWASDYVIVYGLGLEVLPDPYTQRGHRNQWLWIDFNVGTHDARRHVLAQDVLLTQGTAPAVPLLPPPEAITAEAARAKQIKAPAR